MNIRVSSFLYSGFLVKDVCLKSLEYHGSMAAAGVDSIHSVLKEAFPTNDKESGSSQYGEAVKPTQTMSLNVLNLNTAKTFCKMARAPVTAHCH